MANQMIALQARNPQLPDPARATAQYANMMNMASQQRASQLQAERTRQEMDFARAKEGREVDMQAANMREKDLDIEDKEMLRLYKIGAALLETEDPTAREAGYQNLLGLIDQTSPQLGATMRQVAGTFSAPVLEAVMMQTEQYFNKKYPNAQATLEYAAKGQKDEQGNLIPEDTPVQVTTGMKPSTQVIRNAPNAAARATPTAPPVTAGADVDMRATQGANTTPQDLMQQGMDPRNIPSGMPTVRPASFNQSDMGTPTAGQMTPDMVPAILDSAVNTGVMAQIDLDQMLALAPPQARDGIMNVIRSNNISLQADAPSLASSGMSQQQPMAPNPVQRPQSQFADMRGPAPQSQTAGLRGAPPMEQTLAQYIAVKRKDPNVAPTPSPVPAAVLGAQEGAKTSASKNVELVMNPKIAADIKKAERDVERRPEALVAKNETKAAIQSLDRYIEEIDALLRSADRRFIVGRFEGRIPYGLQDERQSELQAMYDRIKNANTLEALVEAKQATPSGGSPVGPASNTDVQLVAKSASSLTQTGGVAKFDDDLKKLRREAYQTRQRRIEFYSDRYGDLAAEDPKFKLNVRPIADRYISTKDLPQNKSSAGARKTSVIPEGAKQMLRKNPSPQQRAFFDRTFGAGAAAKVLGAR
jgi:hypothetical protein